SDVCSSDLYLRNYVISVLLRNGIDTFGRGSTLRTRAQSRRARGGGHVDRAHGGEGGGHVEGSRRILRDGTIIGSRGLRPRPPRRQGHVLGPARTRRPPRRWEIGRASCRERVSR